jgi:hypothetical protein
MERDVREERNGWRDEAISRRHRLYGFHVPALDIDFLMLEYSRGTPKAIIDYKYEKSYGLHYENPSAVAVRKLCDAMTPPIPFLVARYRDRPWAFQIDPMNDAAQPYAKRFGIGWMDEPIFVQLLYALRGDAPPRQVLERLKETTDAG